MCTVTWTSRPGGYALYFNRDERRSRVAALPPAPAVGDGVRYLAPRDPEGGGSWIVASETGWTVCLLNFWASAPLVDAAERSSRGLLVTGLAAIDRFERVAEHADPRRYRPFTLLVLDPAGEARAFRSDGLEFIRRWAPDPPLLSSSSWDEGSVEGTREELWRASSLATGGTRADALAFMTRHAPERGPASPCMHRPDARTVSLTVVEVGAQRVSMAYADGPPCRHPLAEPVWLPRECCSTVLSSP
ncbi:MAG: NRDE family protein [Acidobacteriota bacterium]